MTELLTDPQAWAALVTLTAMEIILGIDNIVFISVLVAKLPAEQAKRARSIGLLLALVFRIIMLLGLTWLIGLHHARLLRPRARLLLARPHPDRRRRLPPLQGDARDPPRVRARGATLTRTTGNAFTAVIAQIAIIDIVFSIDSIITAIGMAQHVPVMIAAVVIAMGVMWVSSGPIGGFIHRHPTTKMLALAFLLLIGVSLVADGAACTSRAATSTSPWRSRRSSRPSTCS